MSIASIEGFAAAALALVGLALAVLVVSVGVASFEFFSENRRVRTAHHEPLVTYYRHLAFS